jgi:hypothetical protein
MNKKILNIKKLDKHTKIDIDDEIILDEDGRATIEVKLQTTQDLFSRYAYKDYDILNNDLDEFIEDRAAFIPLDYELSIHFYTNQIEHLDQEKIEKAVKARYINEYVEERETLRRTTSFSLLLAALGFVFLLILLGLERFEIPTLFRFVFEVATWVFFWGTLEHFFMERPKQLRNVQRKMKLFNAKVKIYKLENDGNKLDVFKSNENQQ